MICVSDPGSQHALLLTGRTDLANNETPFYNVANKVNIQEYCKVQEYNVTATHYNIKQALKIIRKPCGNKKTKQLMLRGNISRRHCICHVITTKTNVWIRSKTEQGKRNYF